MTRATSPCSPLGISAEFPKPIFGVGDRVVFRFQHLNNKAYYFRALLRHELKQVRRHTQEHPLPEFNKDQVRQKLRMVMEAKSIEVAGIAPRFNPCVGHFANESYLPGIRGAASPVNFATFLSFRWQDEHGRNLAYIPELAIVSEFDLAPADGRA